MESAQDDQIENILYFGSNYSDDFNLFTQDELDSKLSWLEGNDLGYWSDI